MSRLRALLGISAPAEARFFQFVGGFGIVIAIVYWLVSYETAGSVLLVGFGVASGTMGVLLALARPGDGRGLPPGDGMTDPATPDADRPFQDEAGRLPSPSLAPFAVGLGASIASTALIFGPAPLLVGAVPFLWGSLAWLRGARAELDAVEGRLVEDPMPGESPRSPGARP